MRLTLDEYYLKLAMATAMRGTCPRAKVGCVLVVSGQLVSVGYNGAPHGCAHCDDAGCILENGHCVRTVHAEINAVAHAKRDLYTATAYVTHKPCYHCTAVLVNAGVTRVVYVLDRTGWTPSYTALVAESGIVLEKFWLKGEVQ